MSDYGRDEYEGRQGGGYDGPQGGGYVGEQRGEGRHHGHHGRQEQGGFNEGFESDNGSGSYGGGQREYGSGRQQGGYGGRQDGDFDSRRQQGSYGRQQDSYASGRQQGAYGSEQQGNYDSSRQQGRYGGQQSYSGPGNDNYGGGVSFGRDEDLSGAAHHAQQHAGGPDDSELYSRVSNHLGQNQQHIGNQQINEQDAVQSHQQLYGGGAGGSSQETNSGTMGSAAAMQALKMLTGGGGANSQGGTGQNQFIGMAMAQASKLFDQQSSQGNVASGSSKESAIQKAGEMALQMYMKSQGGGAGGGGGAASLLSLASKFF